MTFWRGLVNEENHMTLNCTLKGKFHAHFFNTKKTVVYCAALNSSLPRKRVSKLYENPCPELKKILQCSLQNCTELMIFQGHHVHM
jgi:hypothetical protein